MFLDYLSYFGQLTHLKSDMVLYIRSWERVGSKLVLIVEKPGPRVSSASALILKGNRQSLNLGITQRFLRRIRIEQFRTF